MSGPEKVNLTCPECDQPVETGDPEKVMQGSQETTWVDWSCSDCGIATASTMVESSEEPLDY